jgi:ABC-type cobalamin/Fe3+-siderophores transport system ATPase subunit
MALPITPPLKPMLARLARELPPGGFLYEPKWDGFRCLAFLDGDEVELWSRNDKPLARYFPELVAALRDLDVDSCVLDGEIVARDFDALLARLHPAASRVELLSRETPAELVAFDLLAVGAVDLRELRFDERRARLEQLLGEFGLTALRESPAMALSGGERRRCEIARALAAEPSIMLLDEPFAGIDPISIADIRELVRELKSRDIGVLITDHNVRETLDIVDRACIIYGGEVLFAGSPEALVADPNVRRLYLGESFEL